MEEKLSIYHKYKYYLYGIGLPSFLYLFYETYVNYQKHKNFLSETIPLTKIESNFRNNLINNLKYNILILLNNPQNIKIGSNQTFKGQVIIEFEYNDLKDIFIDYQGRIDYMNINQKNVKPVHKNNRVYINKLDLLLGYNYIQIIFESNCSQLKDKVLGLSFLYDNDTSSNHFYTNSEPFYSHRIFPCLDQPDLKGDVSLNVYCKKNLKIISNSNSINSTVDYYGEETKRYLKMDDNELYSLTTFKNLKISPFQITIIGSEFHEIPDYHKQTARHHIYIRKNINHKINPLELSSIVNNSIEWFESKFKTIFPFEKIDLIFIPNYCNVTGSSPGLIIIDENFINLSTDIIDTNYLHFLLVYQIFNQWLLGFLTPKWWDDLFILEGISIYLTNIYYSEKDNDMREIIFNNFKFKALIHDRDIDTHEISQYIIDTEQAELLFDEISCYKTACILKYINNSDLYLTINDFINEHGGGIAESRKFHEIYKSISGNELDIYFKTNKVTKLYYEYEYEGELLKKFLVIQNPIQLGKSDIYLTLNIEILFLFENGEQVYNISILPQEVTDITCIIDQKNPRPCAIILDPYDKFYMTYKFDSFTVEYFRTSSLNITNPVTRIVILRNLYFSMQDMELNPLHFFSYCLNSLTTEKNVYIKNELLKMAIYTIKSYIPYNLQQARFDQMLKLLTSYSDELLKKNFINYILDIIEFSSQTDHNLLFAYLLDIFNSSEQIDYKTYCRLLESLYGSDKLTTLEKNNIENNINSNEFRIKLNNDLLSMLIIKIKNSDDDNRQKIWGYLTKNDKVLSIQEKEAYMKGFIRKKNLNKNLKKLNEKYFFKEMLHIAQYQDYEYSLTFYKNLNPSYIINEKILKRFEKLYDRITHKNNYLVYLISKDISSIKKKLQVVQRFESIRSNSTNMSLVSIS